MDVLKFFVDGIKYETRAKSCSRCLLRIANSRKSNEGRKGLAYTTDTDINVYIVYILLLTFIYRESAFAR